jgi:hypothetical protein
MISFPVNDYKGSLKKIKIKIFKIFLINQYILKLTGFGLLIEWNSLPSE